MLGALYFLASLYFMDNKLSSGFHFLAVKVIHPKGSPASTVWKSASELIGAGHFRQAFSV